MSYVELYSEEILEAINLGKTVREFDETMGDYIKVEVYKGELENASFVFYSNRLLLKNDTTSDLYIGDYHYHPENPEMGFCSEKNHTDNSIQNLSPIAITSDMDNSDDLTILNQNKTYKKQIQVFKDGNGNIYIKSNEILNLVNINRGKYKLRIYFLRDIRTHMSKFLALNKNNLIENGNFFAGLEATQTGDLDRSHGRNNFVIIPNPGYSNFVLEQDGLLNNKYDMKVTGIQPSTYYVFSCWVAWSAQFAGSANIVHFTGAGGTPTGNTSYSNALNWPPDDKTNIGGSWTAETTIFESGDGIVNDKYFQAKTIGGIEWRRVATRVYTTQNADIGSMKIQVGLLDGELVQNSDGYVPSTNPNGRRYFTDLRLEKVENFGNSYVEYINKLKVEN